jgi:cadmium resistance protein CadD (predicted permease)
MALVARWIIPLVLIVLGVALLVYFRGMSCATMSP